MKNIKDVTKIEAREFFNNNPKVYFSCYDRPLDQINDLYEAGASKVWVINEYSEGYISINHIDTIYIKVKEKINPELLVEVCNLKPDECSINDDGDIIRLWWD